MYNDQMILESYFDSVMDIAETVGENEAEEFLLELIHYGATGERTHTLPLIAECTFISLKPYMDNSKKNKEKTVAKNRKAKQSEEISNDTDTSEDECVKE